MRVLVTYGSKRGGTSGLAGAIAARPRAEGHEVDLLPAARVDGLAAWDAVVLGGALYAFHWQRSARRFVQRHRDELRRMPVWMFSSGPLDDSARTDDIPPTPSVRRMMERIDARSHVTFGGRLAPDAKGMIAQAMVKGGHVGDFRDMDRAEAWAAEVAAELASVVRVAGARGSRVFVRKHGEVACRRRGADARDQARQRKPARLGGGYARQARENKDS